MTSHIRSNCVFKGTSTFVGTVTLSGDIVVGDDLTITDDALVGGDLTVTGATVCSTTLGVTGATTLSSTAHIVGAATLDSTLAVTGAVTLTVPLTKANANASIVRDVNTFPIGAPLLVDGVTYKHSIPIGRAGTIKRISVSAAVRIGAGTNTLTIKKNAAGNTLLSTANIDPVVKPTAVYATEDLTLTATGADLALIAGDCILVTMVIGTQTTAGQGYSLVVEMEYTDV